MRYSLFFVLNQTYLTRTAGMVVCLQTTVHDFDQGIIIVTSDHYNRNMAHVWRIVIILTFNVIILVILIWLCFVVR